MMIRFKNSEDVKDQSVYQQVQNFLSDHDVIDTEKEDMFDLLLLVGGTVDQKMHNDFPRIFGGGCLEGEDVNDIGNYANAHEINRRLYNEDMMGERAPASIILDVTSRKCGVNLGFYSSFLNKQGRETNIAGGRESDMFVVKRSLGTKAIINIEGAGVIFAGDFPHFGTRNIKLSNNVLNKKMQEFFKVFWGKVSNNKKMMQTCVTTKGFSDMCRLFLKVKPKENAFKFYHFETVGTVDDVDYKDYHF
jgi:hypothetical protein